MPEKPQSFANHARFHPIYHFVLVPILLINVIVSIVWVVREPGFASAWDLVMACALMILVTLVRVNPLKAQDRVIRLEERLRLYALLPESERHRIPELTEAQLIALRFAADEDLPALANRALNEKLTGKQIKQAINNWRPDYFRV
ncbi:MAG TPA: DUF6526 family protein [Silvibacterium sp.]|nr:DUF6526 family protein [Silvibacterium sp.]